MAFCSDTEEDVRDEMEGALDLLLGLTRCIAKAGGRYAAPDLADVRDTELIRRFILVFLSTTKMNHCNDITNTSGKYTCLVLLIRLEAAPDHHLHFHSLYSYYDRAYDAQSRKS